MRALTLLLFILSAAQLQAAEPTSGKVEAVTDGDTLTVLEGKTQHTARLHGIDAPERKQAFGTKVKDALAAFVFGNEVTVSVADKDSNRRLVGRVKQGGTDVRHKMVADCYAWQYRKYDATMPLARAQAEAMAAKKGLWADPEPTPPWEFRRKK